MYRNENPKLPDHLFEIEEDDGIGEVEFVRLIPTKTTQAGSRWRSTVSFQEAQENWAKRRKVWDELGSGGPYPQKEQIQKRKELALLLAGTPLEVKVLIWKGIYLSL